MNNKTIYLIIVSGLLSWLLGTAGFASAGTITGTVTDSAGNPIAYTQITISGTGFLGTRSVLSAQNGEFFLRFLPSGTYLLVAEFSGFTAEMIEGIQVVSSETIPIDFFMDRGEEPTIRTGEGAFYYNGFSPVGLVLERDFTERLPDNDVYGTFLNLGPGIAGYSNPISHYDPLFIHGSTHADNAFYIDGVNVSDPVTNQASLNLNGDALDSIEIVTGALPAEYGGFMGGLVRVTTKQGRNDFFGTLRFKYVTDDWQAEKDSVQKPPTDFQNRFEPTISLGGPLLKDKLWFFLSYRRVQPETDVKYVRYSYDGTNYVYTEVDPDELWQSYVGNFTWAFSSTHQINVSFSGDPKILHNQGDSRYRPEAQCKYRTGSERYGLHWSFRTMDNLFFETNVGYYNSFLHIDPEHDSGLPAVYDRKAHIWFDNYPHTDHNDRTRWLISGSMNKIIHNWTGSHDLKTGFEYNYLQEQRFQDYTTGRYYEMEWYGTDQETPWARYNFVNPRPEKKKGDYYALYVQDAWGFFPSVQLNAGLRWEQVEYRNKAGKTVHIFNNMIAPRLGMSWDVSQDGKSTVFTHLGRYYSPFDLTIIFMDPGPPIIRQVWRYDPSHPDADEEGYYDTGGGCGDYFSWLIDSDLKPEHTDEFVLGYEHRLTEQWQVGLNWNYRQTRNIIEDVGFYYDQDGNLHLATDVDINDPDAVADWYEQNRDFLYIATNPDGAYRDYSGFELSTSMRMPRLEVEASYTYSRTEGTNVNVFRGNNFSGSTSHFTSYYDTPLLSNNLDGPLFYDAPHVLKISGSYHLPYSFYLGTRLTYRSGYAYNKYGGVAPGPDGQYGTDDDIDHEDPWYGPGYTLPEGRGAYRLPDYFLVDLSLQKDFPFGKWGAITAVIDIFNVFNNRVVIEKDEDEGVQFGEDIGWANPRTIFLQLKYSF